MSTIANFTSESRARMAQQLQQTGARLKDAEQRLVNASNAYAHAHPYRLMGAFLAVGVVVGSLFVSRKSPGSAPSSDKDATSGGNTPA